MPQLIRIDPTNPAMIREILAALDLPEGTDVVEVEHTAKGVLFKPMATGICALPTAEKVKLWDEWCAMPRPESPVLSDAAMSRESMYPDEGRTL